MLFWKFTKGPVWHAPQVLGRFTGCTGLAGLVRARMSLWATNGSNDRGSPPWHVSQPTFLRPCPERSQSDRCAAETEPGFAK